MTNDQTVTQALEPCPICGNRAFIGHGNAPEVNGYPIWCLTDRCLRLPPRKTEAEAITAWNTRTTHSGEGREHPLSRYVQHLPVCKLKMRMGGRCDCGLSELRHPSEGRSNGAGEACPDDIRAQGWSVAVHNDYQLDGISHTFWLFTKADHAVKGEARTDAEALNQVRAQIADLSAPQGEVERADAEEDDRSWLGTSIDRIDAMEEAAQLRDALGDLWSIVHGCDLRLSVPMETIAKVRAALAQPEAGGEHE